MRMALILRLVGPFLILSASAAFVHGHLKSALPSADSTLGKPLTLRPDGYHVVLAGLKAPMNKGDSVPLTLAFEHAPPTTETVESARAAGPDEGAKGDIHDHKGHTP